MKKRKLALISLLFVHLFLLFNTKFTAWPEMTFWPYLMLKGWIPYKDIAVVHTPLLLYLLEGFYSIFGVGTVQLKVFTWGLILLTDLLLFNIVGKLFDKKVSIFALAFFLPLQIFYEGNGLWFDLLLFPLVFSAYYFLKKKRYIYSGILWGLAFLTKQTAVWFLIPVFFTIARRPFKDWLLSVGIKFAYGLGLVLLAFGLVLLKLQIWQDFYRWAVDFGVFTLPGLKGQISLPGLKTLIYSLFPFVFVLPFLTSKKREEKELVVWSIFGVLGAFPRFELFHFQPALPFLAVLMALFFSKKGAPVYKSVMVVGLSVLFVRSLVVNFGQETRFVNESVVNVSAYIDDRVDDGDEIFLVNLWDNIYVHSGTVPATRPFVPGLEWYWEQPGIQKGLVEGLGEKVPGLILVGEYAESGLASYKPELVQKFIDENYELTDTIENVKVYVPN